jgi:hypothetical protein
MGRASGNFSAISFRAARKLADPGSPVPPFFEMVMADF